MSTEKHDPWALLREARKSVDFHRAQLGLVEYFLPESRVSETGFEKEQLLDRIDAALAEHESKERVEWFDYGEWGAKSSKINGFQLTVRAHPPLPGGPWHWEAPRCSGYAATKNEAKSAAIAAARGLE